MDKVELTIIALANSHSSPGNYVLVLQEASSKKRLPIIIGGFEAQAIAIALDEDNPPRPLTHDLFKETLLQLETHIKEVYLSFFKEGIFHTRIICEKKDGTVMELDSRASDAIALAIRFGCPIYASQAVIEEAGIGQEEIDQNLSSNLNSLEQHSPEELEKLMHNLLEEEDYENAAKIRDVLEGKTNEI